MKQTNKQEKNDARVKILLMEGGHYVLPKALISAEAKKSPIKDVQTT